MARRYRYSYCWQDECFDKPRFRSWTRFLSRTGNCKTFDDGADGYCRGEGIGTIIIKRLDDALADNDPILGLILGAYTNHSAELESITRPHFGAQPVIQSEEQDIGIFAHTAVQLASVCLQIALRKLWASWNITPVAVVGHSLDEYAALDIAGVLWDSDTIYLVGTRANLLQENCMRDTHAMLVVKGSVDDIAGVQKDKSYETVCINSPIETVLAGSNEEISILRGLLTDSGMKCTLFMVPYAFHSSQMDKMLSDFERLASSVTFSKAKVPILCPLDGEVVSEHGSFGSGYLARHAGHLVNMFKALLAAKSGHIVIDHTMVLEIGPYPAISGMVKAVLGPQVVSLALSQRGRSTWQVLGATLKYL